MIKPSASLLILVLLNGCGVEDPGAGAARDARRPSSRVQADAWEPMEAGLQLGVFSAPRPSAWGDSRVRVLRVDPQRFELRLLNASATEARRPRTAREWCDLEDCVAAINASMYQTDFLTSVSLMRTRAHVNHRRLSKDKTVLAFDPLDPELPSVKLIDRECEDFEDWKDRYGTLVQSIRMVSCDGRNVWQQQPKRWSTAAIGIDRRGRVLLIHVRSPYSVHDLIEILLELPLDLSGAMYVEGGPEAQLFVSAGGRTEEWVGSYETGFNELDDNRRAWAVPNVIAVVRRSNSDPDPSPDPDPG